jgi:hypothetical protein
VRARQFFELSFGGGQQVVKVWHNCAEIELVGYGSAQETRIVSFKAGPHSNASFTARAFASSAFAASITRHTPCCFVLRRMKNLDFELFGFGTLAGSFTGSPLLKSTRASNQKLTPLANIRSYGQLNLTKSKIPQI